MLFSVLIPLYNSEEYIAECLDSVLAQNFDDYEIVVIDDGSTDNSGVIAEQYQTKYSQIRVIHKENEGVLLTRRRLLKEAKGDYILWVDSDDAVKQNWMLDLSHEIQKNHPDMIISNYEDYDDPNIVNHSLSFPNGTVIDKDQKQIILKRLIFDKCLNELCTKCIKANKIDIDADYNDYKQVRMGDDLFCLFPIIDCANRFEYLDESYYRYRIVDSSITHANTHLFYCSYRILYERMNEYIHLWMFSDYEICRIRDSFANSIMNCIVDSCECSNSYSDFLIFVKKVVTDEKKHPIFSGGERTLSSNTYQHFYQLLTQKKYNRLYYSIMLRTRLSRLKSKLIRR